MRERSHLSSARDIPQAGGAILTGGSEQAAIGTKGEGVDIFLMAKGCDVFAIVRLPQAGGAVLAGGGEQAAIGAEGHGIDAFLVLKRGKLAPVGDLPQTGGAVLAGSGEQAAIGTERDMRYPVLVGNRDKAALSGKVPNLRATSFMAVVQSHNIGDRRLRPRLVDILLHVLLMVAVHRENMPAEGILNALAAATVGGSEQAAIKTEDCREDRWVKLQGEGSSRIARLFQAGDFAVFQNSEQ